MTKIIGHRGAGTGNRSFGLENTIAGFKEAKDVGVHAIEIDVLSTKDNKLVVCHDNDLYRLSGHKKKISELTYAELSEIHLQNKETIPLLYDVLALLGKTHVIIDFKIDKNIEELYKILSFYPDMDITITTYHRHIIRDCKRLNSKIPVFVQRAFAPLGMLRSIKKHGADGLNVKYTLLSPLTYYMIRKHGLQVSVYTVDNKYLAKFIKKLYPGIWIITNNPSEILQFNANEPEPLA